MDAKVFPALITDKPVIRQMMELYQYDFFDLFRGHWEVHQVHTNIVAQKFWRSVIGAYAEGKYTETVMQSKDWTGVVQCFDNTSKLRS
ncbi:MAG: hypothetical protein Kow00121_08320 [Elainellaceae cyanobacterium]